MNIEEKLSAVEQLFTRGSKGFQVAVDIVRKNRDVTMDERALMAEKVGCAPSTVRRVLSKLKKAGLYGGTDEPSLPQKTQEEKEEEEQEEPPEEPEFEAEAEEPEEKYVTQEQFDRLVEEIKILSGITPIQEEEEYVEEQYEAPAPESVDLEQATMKQYGTWIKSQNQLLFDFTKQGAFGGALEDFHGNWSDWVNLCLEDYFTVVHNVGIGLLSRRFAR